MVALLLVVAGCAGGSGLDEDGGGGPPPPMDAGAAARDAGTARDANVALPDTGTPIDAGVDAGGVDPDGGSGPSDVRFVVMGDTGEGNTGQNEVAAAVASTCAVEGCDFVILLGDNIYDAGVDSLDDPQWETKFEAPYRSLSLPFYPVLGNHDYGGVLFGVESGGLGNEWDKGPLEVQYTSRSMRWTMPSTHYTFQMGNVGFVMLDTNSILWDDTTHGDQLTWFAGAVRDLRASGAEWIIGAGHHPIRSNGAHGNAGSYESIEIGDSDVPIPLPILDGQNVLDFLEDHACGELDVYMAGHDHNRQWLNEPGALCGAELFVSGAGAKVKAFDRADRNATHWQDDTTEGFLYVRIVGDTFYGRFVNRDGSTAFERMFMRPSATP